MGGDACAVVHCGVHGWGCIAGVHVLRCIVEVQCMDACGGMHCRGKCGGTCAYGSPRLMSGSILNNYSTLIIEAGFSVKLRAH